MKNVMFLLSALFFGVSTSCDEQSNATVEVPSQAQSEVSESSLSEHAQNPVVSEVLPTPASEDAPESALKVPKQVATTDKVIAQNVSDQVSVDATAETSESIKEQTPVL